MDKSILTKHVILNLLVLASEEGLSTPFSESDVNECMQMEDPDARMRCLTPLKHAVHELLYAPPRRS